MDKSFMYLIYKGIAFLFYLFLNHAARTRVDESLILVLAFCCVEALEYILVKKIDRQNKYIITSFNTIVFLAFFLFTGPECIPLLVILSMELLELYTKNSVVLICSSLIIILSIIMGPNFEVVVLSFGVMGVLVYNKYLLTRALDEKEQLINHKEEIALLRDKLSTSQRLEKSLKYTARLEERNRLAAKLHDKVGHGISGSIILLEASLLSFDKNPKTAKDTMEKAIDNLRSGVDDIRMALREERPDKSVLGFNEIENELNKFKINHGIKTSVSTNGDLNEISIHIWNCIYENMLESLTNLLKHSNGNEYKLEIQVFNKVIKIVYQDNGKSCGKFIKGLGLEAIEERTIKNNGRCFFECKDNGFVITNTFIY